MNKKELLEELERKGNFHSPVMYKPEPLDNKELVQRLKNLRADLSRLKTASVGQLFEDVDTIIYNLTQEVEELDNPEQPELIEIDTVVELYKNRDNIPILQLEK